MPDIQPRPNAALASTFTNTISRQDQVQHFIVQAKKTIFNRNFSQNWKCGQTPFHWTMISLVRDFPSLSIGDIFVSKKLGVHVATMRRSVLQSPSAWCNINTCMVILIQVCISLWMVYYTCISVLPLNHIYIYIYIPFVCDIITSCCNFTSLWSHLRVMAS